MYKSRIHKDLQQVNEVEGQVTEMALFDRLRKPIGMTLFRLVLYSDLRFDVAIVEL